MRGSPNVRRLRRPISVAVSTAPAPVTLISAPRHGKGIQPLVDEKDLSNFLREVSVSADMETRDITGLADLDRVFLSGPKDATVSFDGLFAASTTAADDIANYLDGAFGGSTKQVITVDLERSTGGRALMLRVDDSSYDVASPMDDLVTVAVDAQASDGYAGGRMLRPLLAATATGSNGNILTSGTTTVGGTTSGGVGHFHLTAASTITSLTAKVQHSTTGSTWADLITFTAATAETFQRSTVSGTVKERLRSTISSFSGGAGKSATCAGAFSRRERT